MDKLASVENSHTIESPVRIHSAGGLGWGGFFGGPLALSFLVYRDLRALGRMDLFPKAAVWLVFFIALWLYCVLGFPPDLISQWILYFPQAILWWIVARGLFADVRGRFESDGGAFHSRWK